MNPFKCSHQSCHFTSQSMHGIEVHMACAHRQLQSSGTLRPRIQGHLQIPPVPRNLQGLGNRLPIDRLTGQYQREHAQSQSLPDNHGGSFIDEFMTSSGVGGPTIGRGAHEEEHRECGTRDLILSAFVQLADIIGDRHCDNLLQVLRLDLSETQRFLQVAGTMDLLRNHVRSAAEDVMLKNGFKCEKVVCRNGLKFDLYHKDPVEVLRCQISKTPHSGLITQPLESPTYSHPMNARLGRKAIPSAIDVIKGSMNREVCWSYRCSDGRESFIGAVQIFSDKSLTCEGGVTFYPLHVTLLNFLEGWRRRHICNGATIAAYLPVRFDTVGENQILDGIEVVGGEKIKLARVTMLRTLHDSIRQVMSPLAKTALTGVFVSSADNYALKAHWMLSSYIGDMPEAEDMLSVKRGVTTSRPCHRCQVVREEMANGVCGNARTLTETQRLLNDLKNNENSTMAVLTDLSMLPIPPVFYDFPLLAVHECVDIYRIFRFEPLHNFSLGISRMLKECTAVMLRDDCRVTENMKTSSGANRSFKQIRRVVLREVNKFLHLVERDSLGYGLHVDFAKGSVGERLNGFFTETGIVGNLEAKDYNAIDVVSPFLASTIDLCCGLVEGTLTTVYTRYVDMFQFVQHKMEKPGWSEERFQQLQKMIDAFKCAASAALSVYQPSRMGTSKWHSLDHLVEDLRDMGSIEYLNGALFESSHKIFKKDYRKTSKRTGSVMREVARRVHDREAFESITPHVVKRKRINKAAAQAFAEDRTILVRSGISTTMVELQQARRDLLNAKEDGQGGATVKPEVANLAQTLQPDGMLTLLRQLRERFNLKGIEPGRSNHVKLVIPASAYVTGTSTPTLNTPISGSSAYVPISTSRIIHRIVAKPNFHGSERERADSVMVANNCKDPRYPSESFCPVWIAKMRCFVRIHYEQGTEEELCFVQYYEIIDDSMLQIDAIDGVLQCIRLRWHRTQGEEGIYSAKEFGLVPVESIRGRVHIVRADTALPLLHKDVPRRKAVEELARYEKGWSAQIFYLNRFYRNEGDLYDF